MVLKSQPLLVEISDTVTDMGGVTARELAEILPWGAHPTQTPTPEISALQQFCFSQTPLPSF